MENCLFCKIANGNGEKVFENEEFVIINDINPQAKKHYLLIPKAHYDNITDFADKNSESLARAFVLISNLKEELGLVDGFRVITNIGTNGCQSVKHVHIHILGGEKLSEKMG